MKQTECFDVQTNILSIDLFNTTQLAVTHDNIVTVIQPEKCHTLMHLSLKHSVKNANCIAFHPTQDLIAVADGIFLSIFHATSQKIVQKIKSYDGAILQIIFIKDTPYILILTDQGKILQYRYDTPLQISHIHSPSHATHRNKQNFITVICSKNEYVAYGNNKGNITLFNLYSHTKKLTFQGLKSYINAICFLKRDEIIFADRDGRIFFAKLHNSNSITQIKTPLKNIKQLVPLWEDKFVLIVSNTNTIALLDTAKKQIITTNFLQFQKNIKKVILLNDHTLILLLNDNTITKVTLTTPQQITHAIQNNNLLDAFKLIEQNPMLHATKEAEDLKRYYEKFYKQNFLKFLYNKESNDLKQLKEYDYNNALLAKKNYTKLKQFYTEQKFSLAYALCEKFPPLQWSLEYRKMENLYKKRFLLAQKFLSKNNVKEAHELLKPFITIEKKRPALHLLLRYNKQFITFLQALTNRDYKTIEQLLSSYPNFQELPAYRELQKEIQQKFTTAHTLIDNAQTKEALAITQEFQQSSLYTKESTYLYKRIAIAKEFLSYYEKNNFTKCYEMIDANSSLESMQIVQLLENHWKKSIQKCELYALDLKMDALKNTLDDLLSIRSRKEKLNDILRITLYAQIAKELREKEYKKTEALLYSALDMFTIDNELQEFIQLFEKLTNQKLAITFKQKENNE